MTLNNEQKQELLNCIFSVNKKKSANYWKWFHKEKDAGRTPQIKDFYIIASNEYYQEKKALEESDDIMDGVQDILDGFDLPKEVKELVNKQVSFIYLGYNMAYLKKTRIENDYERLTK